MSDHSTQLSRSYTAVAVAWATTAILILILCVMTYMYNSQQSETLSNVEARIMEQNTVRSKDNAVRSKVTAIKAESNEDRLDGLSLADPSCAP